MTDYERRASQDSNSKAAAAISDACQWVSTHASELVGGAGICLADEPVTLTIVVEPDGVPVVTVTHTNIAL